MALCSWCGKVDPGIKTVSNGSTVLHLCPLCLAQYEFKESGGQMNLDELQRPPGFWERVKKFFQR